MRFVTDLNKGILGQPDSKGLWQEIINHIPDSVLLKKNVKILSVACGHLTETNVLARRMLALGRTRSEIKKSMYVLDKYRVFTNAAKMQGYTNVICEDFLEWHTNMKFDVIVGNPPYQSSDDSGGALWQKFANKAFNDLVKDNGYVALIHPPSFIGKHLSSGKGKSDYTVFANNQIEELHILDDFNKNKHFTGVGTRICWYVARKTNPVNQTKIVGYNGNNIYKFDDYFANVTCLPNSIDDISMSIHKKLVSAAPLKFIQKRELHYYSMKKRNAVSEVESKDFKYKSYFSHKITRFANYKFSDFDTIKVMVPQTSTVDNSFIDGNCNVSEDLYYVPCASKAAAKTIQDYLKSNLVKYIGKNYRPGRNLGSLLMAGIIPNPTQAIKWTREEIDYMESHVK